MRVQLVPNSKNAVSKQNKIDDLPVIKSKAANKEFYKIWFTIKKTKTFKKVKIFQPPLFHITSV